MATLKHRIDLNAARIERERAAGPARHAVALERREMEYRRRAIRHIPIRPAVERGALRDLVGAALACTALVGALLLAVKLALG